MSTTVVKSYGDVYTYTHNPDFPVPQKKDFMEFKELLEKDDGWTLNLDKDGTKVLFRDQANEELLQIKLRTTELKDLDADVVHDVLQDPEFRTEWDSSMKSQHLTEQLDENNEIGYYSVKMPFTITNRDWVNMRSWWYNSDKTLYIIMNHSISHPKEPEDKKFVRAKSLKTGYIIEKTNEGTTLSFFSWNSWNGWIPNWVVNKATKSMITSIIGDLKKACAKYPQWKEKHEPQQKYWMTPGEEIKKELTEQ
ncbi:START domain-containing protein 10 [Entamoeba marina]